jgi:hypothetical protein
MLGVLNCSRTASSILCTGCLPSSTPTATLRAAIRCQLTRLLAHLPSILVRLCDAFAHDRKAAVSWQQLIAGFQSEKKVLATGINEIITLSTIQMHRGVSQTQYKSRCNVTQSTACNHRAPVMCSLAVTVLTPAVRVVRCGAQDDSSGPNLGLAPIPNSTAWDPRQQCQNLTGHPVDTPLVLAGFPAMDQQGVWEARQTRDSSLASSSSAADGFQTTMQQVRAMHFPLSHSFSHTSMKSPCAEQVVPLECDEWHNGGKYKYPQTFIGPPVNLSETATVSCSVLPPMFNNGWAGIGIGGQATSGSTLTASPDVLAVWPNGTWTVYGRSGVARLAVFPDSPDSKTSSTASRWFQLSLSLRPAAGRDPEGAPQALAFAARIDGALVASGTVPALGGGRPKLGDPPSSVTGSSHPFVFLAASYSTAAGNLPNGSSTGSSSIGTSSNRASDSSNAEFKDLCVAVNEWTPSRVTSGPPSPPTPPPTPSPPGMHGLGLAHCDSSDPRQLWTFSVRLLRTPLFATLRYLVCSWSSAFQLPQQQQSCDK